jgi:type I restriction enzyme S subunit
VVPDQLKPFCDAINFIPFLSGGGRAKLTKGKLVDIPVPIPCPNNPKKSLEIQAEIVRILDAFTAMTAELTAELNLRKKQYNYYRDQLLSFEFPSSGGVPAGRGGEVEWKTLGECFPKIRNGFVGTVTPFYSEPSTGVRYLQGTNIKNGKINDNKVYFVNKNFHQKQNKTILKADDILVVQSGHVGDSAVVGNDYEGSNCHALIVMSNGGGCSSKFVNYYLQSAEGQKKLQSIVTGGTVKHILASKIKKVTIPLPPIAEQARIVTILDKFDALTNSITEGLPREIELRQKQYEYYRDLLLSFPKPGSEVAA